MSKKKRLLRYKKKKKEERRLRQTRTNNQHTSPSRLHNSKKKMPAANPLRDRDGEKGSEAGKDV